MSHEMWSFVRNQPSDDDRYTDVRLALSDEKGTEEHSTPFGASKTAELDIQFAIDPSFGLTRERYGWYTNGNMFDSTNFSQNLGKIEIETAASSGDSARLRSAYPGQYVPHTISEPGIGAVIPPEHLEFADDGTVSLTHGQIRLDLAQWSDANQRPLNSIGVSYESDATYMQVRSGDSTVEHVPQEKWNIDQMDGTGPSGHQLRPQDGYIHLFFYSWYGEGSAILMFANPQDNRLIPAHRYVPDEGNPHVESPDMAVQATVDNKDTADPLLARIGGIQYATHGRRSSLPGAHSRETILTRRTTGSTIATEGALTNNAYDPFAEPGVPLVAFRRLSNNIIARKSLDVEVENVFINTTQDVMLYIWDEFNPDTALTGASFGSPPVSRLDSNETKLETDTQATDYAPSSDAVLRSMVYIDADKKTASRVAGSATTRLPLEATSIVTVVLTVGANATDAQPFRMTVDENF